MKKETNDKEIKEKLVNIDSSLATIANKQKTIETTLKMMRKEINEMALKDMRFQKQIKEISEVNKCVDETLCNVLLAIRQNEYLQAWYPEQYGYPEQKVTGAHPRRADFAKSRKTA